MEIINFYRGLEAKYNPIKYSNGIYFCTDTLQIMMNGKSYGGGVKEFKYLDNGKLVITLSNKQVLEAVIPEATKEDSGIMSALDKKNLDRIITDTYPIKITSFTNNLNLREVGSNNTGTFTWVYSNLDFHPIQSQLLNNINITDLNARTYTISDITSSTHLTLNYTLTVSTADGKTVSKNTSILFNHPTYIGAIKTFSISEIKKLVKSIEWGRNTTKKVTLDDSRLIYCYPSYFGDLSSIKNSSGFEGINGYDKLTLPVGGQQYTVYIQKIAATATDTYTFK